MQDLLKRIIRKITNKQSTLLFMQVSNIADIETATKMMVSKLKEGNELSILGKLKQS
jgi:hypothetical protein